MLYDEVIFICSQAMDCSPASPLDPCPLPLTCDGRWSSILSIENFLQDTLKAMFQRIEPFDRDSPLMSIGLDSLRLTQFLETIGELFSVSFALEISH